ncbi:MAG: hypothetical protein M3R08_10600 [Bacteroidota bacterium]|nr:hypothetical protein [Bacteroidota bacterium]
MNTLINTLMIAGAVIAIQVPAVSAQDKYTDQISITDERAPRQDKVKADLSTPADRKDNDVFVRTATLNENGQYAVVVKDEQGNVRLSGTYADEDLKVADGIFTYYYANGTVESKGLMHNGVKTGTWERFSNDGTPKAERNYTGMTWDDMAVTLGEAQ